MSDTRTLSLVTFDPDATPAPSGSLSFQEHDCSGYLCQHEVCVAEREHRATFGVKRPPRQPYEPRVARGARPRGRQPWQAAA